MKKLFYTLLFFISGILYSQGQWQVVHQESGVNFVDGCFTSDSIGYVVRSNGLIFRTLDQGSTWSYMASLPGLYTTICKSGGDTVYAAGNYVYRSIDQGFNWQQISGFGDKIFAIPTRQKMIFISM